MGEVLKPAGQWIAQNVPLSILIALLVFSVFFKIPKKEIHLLTWLLQKLGNVLLGGVKQDIKEMRDDNVARFHEMKTDRAAAISELKADYIQKIADLRDDLDNFETQTRTSMENIVNSNNNNCLTMHERLNEIEKKQDLQTVARIRAHILNFSEDIRRGNTRTIEDFNNIIEEDKEYEEIVKKYKLENNIYLHAIKYINKKYDEYMETDGFAKY